MNREPLVVRMDRYLDEFCPFYKFEPTYIPIHPDDTKAANDLDWVYRGLPIRFIGDRD